MITEEQTFLFTLPFPQNLIYQTCTAEVPHAAMIWLCFV